MNLMRDVLALNGIASNKVRIRPSWAPGQLGLPQVFLVKGWADIAAAPRIAMPASPDPFEAGFTRVITYGRELGDLAVPPVPARPLEYGDVIRTAPPAGLAGQKSYLPGQAVFGQHFIVQPVGLSSSAAPYYDPSYGTTFLGPLDFEQKAVAGYANQFESVRITDALSERVRLISAPLGWICFHRETTPTQYVLIGCGVN